MLFWAQILDDCNGRSFNDSFGYRYHTRSRAQVDETATTNTGKNNTDNWKYVLGCYRGTTNVEGRAATNGSSVCTGAKVNDLGKMGNATGGTNAGTTTAPTTTTSSSKECIPGDATVTLASGESKRMDELCIGDHVSVGNGEFSEVFMFTHQRPDVMAQFVRLSGKSGAVLELTAGHFIYSNEGLVPASHVKIGDAMVLSSGVEDLIVDVNTVTKLGLFNPQTIQGDISVNGVRVSTYTTAVEPTYAHAILAPLRALHSLGISGHIFSFTNGADGMEPAFSAYSTLTNLSSAYLTGSTSSVGRATESRVF